MGGQIVLEALHHNLTRVTERSVCPLGTTGEEMGILCGPQGGITRNCRVPTPSSLGIRGELVGFTVLGECEHVLHIRVANENGVIFERAGVPRWCSSIGLHVPPLRLLSEN